MTINELAEKSYIIAKERGFWDKNRNIGELLMLVTSELGEALEAHRKDNYNFKKTIITTPPPDEVWVDVEGLEGKYSVSNLGRVKNVGFYTINVLNKKSWNQSLILRPGTSRGGYRTVVLGGTTRKISRLVASAFIPNPINHPMVNHINGIKTDDNINNLEWCSYSENSRHAVISGLRSHIKILSLEDKINIAFDWKSNIKAVDIAKKYPAVGLSAIKNVCRISEKYTDGFEFEIADAIIRLLDLCAGHGIDIEYYINRKMQYNSTRNKLHGKRY